MGISVLEMALGRFPYCKVGWLLSVSLQTSIVYDRFNSIKKVLTIVQSPEQVPFISEVVGLILTSDS